MKPQDANDSIKKIKQFIEKLEFTDAEIQDYCNTFNISKETMTNMAKRITAELKHDLEKTLG